MSRLTHPNKKLGHNVRPHHDDISHVWIIRPESGFWFCTSTSRPRAREFRPYSPTTGHQTESDHRLSGVSANFKIYPVSICTFYRIDRDICRSLVLYPWQTRPGLELLPKYRPRLDHGTVLCTSRPRHKTRKTQTTQHQHTVPSVREGDNSVLSSVITYLYQDMIWLMMLGLSVSAASDPGQIISGTIFHSPESAAFSALCPSWWPERNCPLLILTMFKVRTVTQ